MTYPAGQRLAEAVKKLGLESLVRKLAEGSISEPVEIESSIRTGIAGRNRLRMVLYGVLAELGLGHFWKVKVAGPQTLRLEPKFGSEPVRVTSVGGEDSPVIGGVTAEEILEGFD